MTCPSCGQDDPEGSFCTGCGTRLQAARPQAVALAEPFGERKQITILFASLHEPDSIELTELNDRDPEAVRYLVDSVLESMMDAVHRNEGAVVNAMGDGIEAYFGVPLVREDHAVRACHAALQIQEAINRRAEDVRRAHGVDVRVRVGLNSGEVVVRYLSPDLRMDYRAVGDPVNVASHLTRVAEPGSILVGSATRAAVQSVARVESVEPLRIDGRREPIVAYRLVAIERARQT